MIIETLLITDTYLYIRARMVSKLNSQISSLVMYWDLITMGNSPVRKTAILSDFSCFIPEFWTLILGHITFPHSRLIDFSK